MGRENTQEALCGSLSEPHGLCHISEVIDWIMTHERSNKADR